MRHSDIIKLHERGLITDEQRRKIIETLGLKEESSHFMAVITMIGAVLVAAGMVLLISANWGALHRGFKLAGGIVLMLGAYGAGWRLRETRGLYPQSGEACYLLGGGLWLANIALVGQIYNLSSRPPNAILLWALGLAPLPWILRSRALLVLSLGALVTWLGFEMNDRQGLFGGELEQAQVAIYALFGFALAGWSGSLRQTSWREFAGPAFKIGMLLLLAGAYPICWRHFDADVHFPEKPVLLVTSATLFVLGLSGFVVALRGSASDLTTQWRWTWGVALTGMAGLVWLWLLLAGRLDTATTQVFVSAFALILLFLFSLLAVQVGAMLRSPFLVNLAVIYIVLLILAAYVDLFGSMATTGWAFVTGGLFLLAMGVYLEKKRRVLLAQMRSVPPLATP